MQKLALVEKITPLIINMLLPALLFAVFLFGFYLSSPFEAKTNMIMHIFFYIFSFVSTILLLHFNLNKSLFFIFSIIITYILINLFKYSYGDSYLSSVAYQNLSIFLPINLIFFYFWRNNRFFSKNTLYLLFVFFAEFTIAEYLTRFDIRLAPKVEFFGHPDFNIISFALFSAFCLITFINAIRHGDIWNYNAFFTGLFIILGLYYSPCASGLSIFFLGSIICLLLSISQNIYLDNYYDNLTKLYSRNSFIIHSKKFPLKYSIGIISIDDYNKLALSFGKSTQNILVKLIATKILELEKIDSLYRYSPDEFIIIYKNLDKNETFKRIEEIRRNIASAQFAYSAHKKPIKLTISGAVSEKKRRDLNSFEVLTRARKELDKTRSFSHNVTSKA